MPSSGGVDEDSRPSAISTLISQRVKEAGREGGKGKRKDLAGSSAGAHKDFSAGDEGGNLYIDAKGLDYGSPSKKDYSTFSPSEPDMKDCIIMRMVTR